MARRRSTSRRKASGRALAAQAAPAKPGLAPWAIAGAILAALLWSFWPVIVGLMRDWKNDPNYSIGQLVPFAALYLLWQERAALRRDGVSRCWWGLALLLLAAAARLYGLLYLYESAERYALVLTIAGLTLLVAGRAAFWRVRWILLFLLLMVPLPGRVHDSISLPLQTYATVSTVFVLELAGTVVSRDGNVMVLNDDTPLVVAEACSGHRRGGGAGLHRESPALAESHSGGFERADRPRVQRRPPGGDRGPVHDDHLRHGGVVFPRFLRGQHDAAGDSHPGRRVVAAEQARTSGERRKAPRWRQE